MTHEQCQEFIQRELDHDLSPAELQQLEDHVQSCPDCRQEREAYQKLAMSMQALPPVMPERDLVPEITLDVLHSLQPEHVMRKPKRRFALWSGLSVAAAAVLAVSLTGSWGAGQKQAESGTDATPQAVAVKTEDDKTVGTDENGGFTSGRTAETPNAPTDTGRNGEAGAGGTSGGETPVVIASQDPSSDPHSGSSDQPAAPPPTNRAGDQRPDAPAEPADPPAKQPDTADQPEPEPASEEPKDTGISVAITAPGTDEPREDEPVVGIVSIGGEGQGGHYGITSEPLPPETSPATVPVGSAPLLPQLNGDLQQAVLSGDTSAKWATDPFQVVTRHLQTFGFGRKAVVTTTVRPEVIRVIDGGTTYRITLHQPFQLGENGIWVPLRIDRSMETNPASYDLPVLEFFRQLQASGEIIAYSSLYAEDEFQSGQLLVSVDLTQHKDGQQLTERWHYLFTMKQTTAGEWKLQTHTARR